MSKLPEHIAIIMDGNGRWASARLMPRSYGHSQGVKALDVTLRYAFSLGIRIVSVYAFSTENRSRPRAETERLFALLREYIDEYSDKMQTEKIKLNIMGDISKLPADLQTAVSKALKLTANNTGGIFNIGLNYGGRDEILRAVNKLLAAGNKNINADEFEKELYTAGLPDPDLIIRPGGELRLSNFMLWQAAYSELYFTDVLWPDFDKAELQKALQEYGKRERRFGKVTEKNEK
ncbi:MAG: di-trans,poly-cis-decaprenylcistransferase [Clostridiales bacterium]|nr:di-trans,poly-cis-decaprenylcistransferase [Clostridiales bacterium]